VPPPPPPAPPSLVVAVRADPFESAKPWKPARRSRFRFSRVETRRLSKRYGSQLDSTCSTAPPRDPSPSSFNRGRPAARAARAFTQPLPLPPLLHFDWGQCHLPWGVLVERLGVEHAVNAAAPRVFAFVGLRVRVDGARRGGAPLYTLERERGREREGGRERGRERERDFVECATNVEACETTTGASSRGKGDNAV
jgi:hypothetical protein